MQTAILDDFDGDAYIASVQSVFPLSADESMDYNKINARPS